MDTNHESPGHKPSRHVEMFATKSGTSSQQSCGLVEDTNHEEVEMQSCFGNYLVSMLVSIEVG